MKRVSLRAHAAAFVTFALMAGCAGVPVDFASRSVSDRSQVDLTQGKKISASASGFQLLLFIPIGINGRHKEAYDALLEQAGDSVLSDITITESWKYGFVGTTYITTIEATAYPRKASTSK
jgi:hypothetical protein